MCQYEVPRSHVVFPLLLQLIQESLIKQNVMPVWGKALRMRNLYWFLRVWGRRRLTDSWCLHHLKLVTELRAPPRLWMSDRTSGMKPQDCDPSSRSVSSHPSPSPSLPRSLLLLFTSSHPLLLHFLSLSLSVWFCEKAGPNLRFSTSVSSTESVYPCAIFYVHSNENFKS